jgi:hypothetical protein
LARQTTKEWNGIPELVHTLTYQWLPVNDNTGAFHSPREKLLADGWLAMTGMQGPVVSKAFNLNGV